MLKFEETARITFEDIVKKIQIGPEAINFLPKIEDLRNPGTNEAFNVLQAFEGSDLRKKREIMRKKSSDKLKDK